MKLGVFDLKAHLALDLLLLLGKLDDGAVLVSNLLEVNLYLLGYAGIRSLSKCVIKLSHSECKKILPCELSIVEKINHLLTGLVCLLLLGLDVLLDSLLEKVDSEVSL